MCEREIEREGGREREREEEEESLCPQRRPGQRRQPNGHRRKVGKQGKQALRHLRNALQSPPHHVRVHGHGPNVRRKLNTDNA